MAYEYKFQWLNSWAYFVRGEKYTHSNIGPVFSIGILYYKLFYSFFY